MEFAPAARTEVKEALIRKRFEMHAASDKEVSVKIVQPVLK